MWAEYYANPLRVAEFKAAIIEHTGLKNVKYEIGVCFMKDNTAAIVYANGDEPVAIISVDWADICLRITYIRW